jgi:hypothetical protein
MLRVKWIAGWCSMTNEDEYIQWKLRNKGDPKIVRFSKKILLLVVDPVVGYYSVWMILNYIKVENQAVVDDYLLYWMILINNR